MTDALRWSFGGNRIQVKAETHLLNDVQEALRKVQDLGLRATNSNPSLHQKQDLLNVLLTDEQTRLLVWLFPLNYHSKHHFASGAHSGPNEVSPQRYRLEAAHSLTQATLSNIVKPAWMENPRLAVHLTQRFTSARLTNDIRWLLLNFPAKGLDIPDALELLLGAQMPDDVSFQLKVSLRNLLCDRATDKRSIYFTGPLSTRWPL